MKRKSLLQNGLWTDPGILTVFSVKVLRGDRKGLLKDLHSFVITQRTAERFFPKEDPIGKTFRVEEKYDMTVSAVIENPPPNASKAV